MGKARIISDQGEGQYTIEIIEARERAESTKQQAQSRINERRTDIAGLESDIIAAQRDVDRAAGDQSDAIAAYRAGNLKIAELSSYAEAVAEAARARESLLSQKRSKKMLIASDETLIARVNALPALRKMQAWCADQTEELSGVVATAEVPGEIGQVIIKPGFEGSNSWSAGADGAMQPALAGTPAGAFYNLAMLPGWQKWRPTFRTATITAIDGDECDISLDSASSSQGFGVNAKSSYSGVPIMYMDCDGAAFEEGDRVLVAFAGNVKGPTVVGFVSEPKGCTVEFMGITAFNETEIAGKLGENNMPSSSSRKFYDRREKGFRNGRFAVSCFDVYDPKNRKNYIPSWATVAIKTGARPDVYEYLSIYESTLEKLGKSAAKNVVVVGDRSGSSVSEIPAELSDMLKNRGVKNVYYQYETKSTEDWSIPLAGIFPTD